MRLKNLPFPRGCLFKSFFDMIYPSNLQIST